MQLTMFTDYALRVLLYLGHKNELSTTTEISKNFKMSQNHVVKVIHLLSQKGLIESFKGKGGGIKLANETLNMNLFEIVKITEPHFHLVECFDKKNNLCPIIGFCDLENILYEARNAFFEKLKEKKLKDLLKSPLRAKKMKLLSIET